MNKLFLQDVNGGMARIDVQTDGAVRLDTYKAGGNNTYVSLEGMNFPTAGTQADTPIAPITSGQRQQDIRITGV